MYNVSRLKAEFVSLVGILQSNLPQIPVLQPPLTVSLSGVYMQDKHPLVTLENIYYAAPDFNINNWNAWVSGRSYIANYVVNYNNINLYKSLNGVTNSLINPTVSANAVAWISGHAYIINNISILGNVYYVCTSNVTGTTSPDLDPTHWSVTTDIWQLYLPFQNWVQQKYDQSTSNMMSEVVKRKKLLHMARALVERVQLYRGGGSINKAIIPSGSFVGFEILPEQAEGLLVFIDEIGIQSTLAQTGMKFYLYHSTVEDYLNVWEIDISKPNTFSWKGLYDTSTPPERNCIMRYLEENTSGVYYFGYYQDDLLGSAISKQWDCSSSPCAGCDNVDLSLYNQWSRYTTFRNIQVPSRALNTDRTLFDKSQIVYNTATNWGLNLSITVRCDLTDTIIYDKAQIADVFAYQLAKEFISVIAQNSRINPTNSQIQTQARAELDIKFPGAWINEYNKSIDALNLDLSGFNKACMPCDNTKKIKMRTV